MVVRARRVARGRHRDDLVSKLERCPQAKPPNILTSARIAFGLVHITGYLACWLPAKFFVGVPYASSDRIDFVGKKCVELHGDARRQVLVHSTRAAPSLL